jgi:D-alanine-D-alanine ligase
VALVYNLKRSDASEDDSEAEFDSPKTIAGLKNTIVELGYEALELEALPDLPERLLAARPDLVFNIAEGRRGRNRESQVPALCELLGLAHTGSDAMTLGMCLDKSIAKRLLLQAALPTPRFILMRTGREKLPLDLRFPLIAKPNAEGTSKGLGAKSVVEDEGGLRLLAKELLARYRQPVIVEEYIAGREITVGLLGWPKPRMLAPMEVHLAEPGVKHPVYHYRLKLDFTEHTRFECPARLAPEEVARIEKVARAAYELLGCLDVTRLDFRLTPGGVPNLIEINPLPGLSPGFSDLALIAEGSGLAYRDLVAEILKGAIARASRAARPSSEEGRIPWRTAAPSFEG